MAHTVEVRGLLLSRVRTFVIRNGAVVEELRASAGGGDNEHLGDLLRNTRLARNMSLEAVEARTKIGRRALERLEGNDLTNWHSERFYKEHFLRVYAREVGLNPQDVVDRFRREFPIVEASPAPVEPPIRLRPIWMAAAAACAAAFVIGFAGIGRPSAAPEPEARVAQNATPPPAAEMNTKMPAVPDVPRLASAEMPLLPSPPAPSLAQPAVAPVAPAEPASLPGPGDIEGELLITSTPPGAHVTVNGVARGATPVRVQFLPPGSYEIRIIGTGYRIAERRATLTPARPQASVSVTLEP